MAGRKHVTHDLLKGNVLVHQMLNGTRVKMGLPSGHLEIAVSETNDRNVVQLHLQAFNVHGDGLGFDPGGFGQTSTIAWCFLNCKTGEMTQEAPE